MDELKEHEPIDLAPLVDDTITVVYIETEPTKADLFPHDPAEDNVCLSCQ